MDKRFRQSAGLMLCLGSALGTLAMVLHPVGGSMQHIINIQPIIVFSHSLAIFCLPIMGFGAWGLSVLLQTPSRIALLPFFVFCAGLIAAMLAGTINGLVFPYYVERYFNADVSKDIVNASLNYGRYLNAALDYIFIAACAFAVGGWSVMILVTRRLPQWLGYYGGGIIAVGMVGVVTGFNFISVSGFTIFVLGLVSWLVLAGVLMWRSQNTKNR
ncbi:hypothetical protein [Emticicia sp. 17c]|uniref:hypothetical protein n=1 Tax=Emticicia sp. 17c TaxID=3127704 RepID=UPI00301BA758